MKRVLWSILICIVLLLPPAGSRSEDGSLTSSKDTSSTGIRPAAISVQVAAFQELKRSEQELIRLESYGLEPFMRHETVPDKGRWYRIFVGRFEERDQAAEFARNLQEQGIISGFWIKRMEIPLDQEAPPQPQPAIEKTDGSGLKLDVEREKQTLPLEVIEIPAAAIPPQAEAISPSKPIESSKDRPPPPPAPVEMDTAVMPEKDPEAALTKKPKIKETLPPHDIQKTGPILPVQQADNDQETGRFSLGARSSFFLAPQAEDFSITRSTGTNSQSWSFQDAIVYYALISNYRLNSAFLIEAGIERAFFSHLDIWHLTLGPKVEFSKIGLLTPYAKGSLVIGSLEWDEAPGNFDLASGWECGFGISFAKSKLQIGFETAYRSIGYDYNLPSESGVSATDSQLDFSGFALSATLGYWF